MPRKKIRLTIDSSVSTKEETEMINSLHCLIVNEVSTMNMSGRVQILLEVDPTSVKDQPTADYPELEQQPISKLSQRQQQVVAMLCNHYSVKRISSELFLSDNTVKKHIQNIKKVLGMEQSGSDFIYMLKKKLQ